MSGAADDFFAAYPPEIAALARSLRAVIRDQLPALIEQVDPSSKIVGYGCDRTYAGMVCAIAPFSAHVNLMFARGAGLTDPGGRLAGTGKRARHVRFKPGDTVDTPAVRGLLAQAAELTRREMQKKR